MFREFKFFRYAWAANFIFGFFLICCNLAYGWRATPKPVTPVEYKGIRFEAPTARMGYVEARDAKTEKLLWEKKIYNVKIDPDIEIDSQEVFINSLKIEGQNLIVINEKNERFVLEIAKIKNELKKFSEMLEANLKRYPFLKFDCRKDNCDLLWSSKHYLFYEKINRYPASLVGEHHILKGEDGNLIRNARAYYVVDDCGCSPIFLLNKGGDLEEVSSEEFYRYLYEQGDLLQVFSLKNVTIIERVQ